MSTLLESIVMSKTLPDQDTVNSLFKAVEINDQNASVTLSILIDELDFDGARRSISISGNEGEGILAFDPLDIYLHSVYHNGSNTINVMLDAGYNNKSNSSLSSSDNIAVLQKSKSLKCPIVIDKGNDVCWAILSNHPEALKNLDSAYTTHKLQLDVNLREAIPYSVSEFRNHDAKKHSPLDLAVMLYVAQKRADDEKNGMMNKKAQTLDMALSPIVEKFKRAGINIEGVSLIPSQKLINEFQKQAPATADNIRLLLQKGAVGSISAYFPDAEESLDNPFMNSQGFEIMSLKEFCEKHESLFPADIFRALTNMELIKPEQHI